MENATIPAKRALAALDKPPADVDTSVPARRISKKVRTAIGYMVNGECKQISEAATKAGLARETLSRALSQPHIAEYLRQVLRHLAIQAARAGAVKGDLLDCSTKWFAIAHPPSCSGSPASSPSQPCRRRSVFRPVAAFRRSALAWDSSFAARCALRCAECE
jgi:hypothetical protein